MDASKKDESKEWADAVCVTDLLLERRDKPRQPWDPRLAVQTAAENVFLNGGPIEVFSQAMPTLTSSTGGLELNPIDMLYGRYLPNLHRIEIFVRRIEQDSHLFNCTPVDLQTIVRLHQYAHAICHLGVAIQDAGECLSNYGASKETDWSAFGAQRDRLFGSFDARSHELLAQALTWSCLSKKDHADVSRRLLAVFSALEAKQPAEYRLTDVLKEKATRTNWRLVLDGARGVINCVQGPTFKMSDGLSYLIQKAAADREAVKLQ